MRAIIAEHGDERRTRIDRKGDATVEVTEVAPSVETAPILVALGADGGVKSLSPGAYKRVLAKEVPLRHLAAGETTSFVLFPTDKGRVFVLRGHEIPDAPRTAKGETLRKLARVEPGENPLAALMVPDLYDSPEAAKKDKWSGGIYLTLFSAQGKIKKSLLSEYRGAAQQGVVDFKLAPGDKVVAACVSDGEGEYIVMASDGKALRFGETEVRHTGRGTQGMASMNVAKGASVVAAGVIGHRDKGTLLIVAQNGYGKRTPLSEFPVKGRATGGVAATTPGFTIGAVCLLPEDGEVLVRTTEGATVRLGAREIPKQGRASRGAVLMKLDQGDKVAGLMVYPPEA
jgi:DNA gyrase subunit A